MTTTHPIKRLSDDVRVLHTQPHRHWHYVYKHRRARKFTDKVSTKQIIAGQLFTVIASVFAGLVLDINKEHIGMLLGAFVIMPGVVDLSASLTGAMAAKINHHLDETNAHPVSILLHDVAFALSVGSMSGLIVGLFGGVVSWMFFDGDILTLTALGLLSMITISLLGNPLVAILTILIKRLNMNPDNIVGPIQSSVIDILAILVIAFYAGVFV